MSLNEEVSIFYYLKIDKLNVSTGLSYEGMKVFVSWYEGNRT